MSWAKLSKKWQAHLRIDGKLKFLTNFDTKEAAAREFDAGFQGLGRVL